MKPHLRSLKRGQEIWALVEESMAGDELIINFSGDLVRVKNKTLRPFRVGQRVLLQVQSIFPLKLKLVVMNLRPRSNSGVDISI